jgi:hypothetical protein
MRSLLLTLVMIPLAACASGKPLSTTGPVLDPIAFFAPGTIGEGVLVHRDGRVDRRFTVKSELATDAGTYRIRQHIRFDDGEERQREWTLEPRGEGRYTGTLTDSGGEVTARAEGNALRLSYPIDGLPLGRMEQFLYLEPDGRTVVNFGTVRVANVTVRRLHEVIVQQPLETPDGKP